MKALGTPEYRAGIEDVVRLSAELRTNPDYLAGYREAMREVVDKIKTAEWPGIEVLRRLDMADVNHHVHILALEGSPNRIELDFR